MRILSLLLALLWALPVAAQTPELTFGADAKSNAPYAFADPADDTRLIGFEKEIIDAVARRMGRTARLVQNDWEALIPGLNRGLYDVVMNGLEITPEHEQAVDFSSPYYTTFEQLAVRAGDPYRTLGDLWAHKVGTLKSSLAERILRAARDIGVVGYDEETDAYSDLANGRVDAVLLDYPIALYYATPNPALRLVGEPIGRIRYGIAMRKGDTALRQQVNKALKDVMASGELRRILERWNLWTPTMATELDDFSPSTVRPVMYGIFWTKPLRPAPGVRCSSATWASCRCWHRLPSLRWKCPCSAWSWRSLSASGWPSRGAMASGSWSRSRSAPSRPSAARRC